MGHQSGAHAAPASPGSTLAKLAVAPDAGTATAKALSRSNATANFASGKAAAGTTTIATTSSSSSTGTNKFFPRSTSPPGSPHWSPSTRLGSSPSRRSPPPASPPPPADTPAARRLILRSAAPARRHPAATAGAAGPPPSTLPHHQGGAQQLQQRPSTASASSYHVRPDEIRKQVDLIANGRSSMPANLQRATAPRQIEDPLKMFFHYLSPLPHKSQYEMTYNPRTSPVRSERSAAIERALSNYNASKDVQPPPAPGSGAASSVATAAATAGKVSSPSSASSPSAAAAAAAVRSPGGMDGAARPRSGAAVAAPPPPVTPRKTVPYKPGSIQPPPALSPDRHVVVVRPATASNVGLLPGFASSNPVHPTTGKVITLSKPPSASRPPTSASGSEAASAAAAAPRPASALKRPMTAYLSASLRHQGPGPLAADLDSTSAALVQHNTMDLATRLDACKLAEHGISSDDAAAKAAAAARPPGTAATDDDGVEARLAAIRAEIAEGGDVEVDIVAGDGSEGGGSGGGGVAGTPAALNQAEPQVLCLDDPSQSSLAVLEQELEGLSLQQLQRVKVMLDEAEGARLEGGS